MNKARVATWLPVLAVGAGLALRLVALGRKSLWLDEAVTLRVAAGRVSDILSVRWELHLPLYYLVMHYWIGLGLSEFVLRLPSALIGAAAVPLLYRLVWEWGGGWSATAAAWLLATAPLHVWYSQEARMYAPVCTLGLASALFYVVAVRRQSPLAWGAWGLATVAGLYTHYAMWLVVLAQVILWGPLWQASHARRAAPWQAFVALLVVLLVFMLQARTFMARLGAGAGRSVYWYYTALQSLLSKWGVALSPAELGVVVTLAGLTAVAATGVVAWMLRGRLRQVRAGTGLTLAGVVTYLLILVASVVPRGLGLKRHALILLPYVLGGLAALIGAHRNHIGVLVGLVAVTLPLTGYVVMAQEQEDWRGVARFLEQRGGLDDVILISAPYMQQPFDYYYRGEVRRQGVGPGSVPEAVSELAMSHERVWLVLSNDRYTDPQGVVQHWLDEHRVFLDERAFERVRVRLYGAE